MKLQVQVIYGWLFSDLLFFSKDILTSGCLRFWPQIRAISLVFLNLFLRKLLLIKCTGRFAASFSSISLFLTYLMCPICVDILYHAVDNGHILLVWQWQTRFLCRVSDCVLSAYHDFGRFLFSCDVVFNEGEIFFILVGILNSFDY